MVAGVVPLLAETLSHLPWEAPEPDTARVKVKADPVLLTCRFWEAGSAAPIWYLKDRVAGVTEMSEAAWREAANGHKTAATQKRFWNCVPDNIGGAPAKL
jgi:hypothetical protein